MLIFFFKISISRVLDYDNFRCNIDTNSGRGEFDKNKDSKPCSKFAYVHQYCCDDLQMRFILQAEILGYQLKQFNKSIDRVLLLPLKISIPEKHKKILKSVYTHFIYRPFIQWPCQGPEIEEWEKSLYFRLNIWTLNYSKLLFINGFNYFLRDPSSIFEFHPPAAAPDYQTWVIARRGPTQNMDFLLIEPSMQTFNEIVKFGGCEYISEDVNKSDFIGTGQGPYDNGLIIKYFNGDIATLQWWWNYEMPGHHIFKLHHIYRYFDPQVVSLRFSSVVVPWVDKESEVSNLWVQEAEKLYNEFGETIDHQSLGLTPSNNDPIDLPTFKSIYQSDNEEAASFYPEFQMITNSQFLVQCMLIIIISILFVSYSLTMSS